ncbi:MAG: GtrA family protein [Pseudomonadota bacterium]|nr:GtrA family protein [Pseudomonadota bacterium]
MTLHPLLLRHRALALEFLRFGTVGSLGFLVDTAIVYGLRRPLGLIGAGLASYLVAATVTWALNRAWTFRGRGQGSMLRQWATFLGANALGFLLNRGTYAALVLTVKLCAAYPVLATAAGTGAGMFVNFGLSRRLVFRERSAG